MQDGVVELPADGQRPLRGVAGRPVDDDVGGAEVAVDVHVDVAVLEWGQLDAGARLGTVRSRCQRERPLPHLVVEAAAGRHRVDEAPLHRLLPLHALGAGREHVGQVAADVALVDQACQSTSPGQDRQQRHLRQRDGG